MHSEIIKGSALECILEQQKLSAIGTSSIVDDIKRSMYCLQVSLCEIYRLLKDAHKYHCEIYRLLKDAHKYHCEIYRLLKDAHKYHCVRFIGC